MIAINENVVTPDLDAIKTNANAINQTNVETNIGHKINSKPKSKSTENPIINIQTDLETRAEKQSSHCSSLSSSDGLTPPSSGSSGKKIDEKDIYVKITMIISWKVTRIEN